jgi:elongation factor P
LGRGGAILRAKLKNLLTGALIDFTFKGNEKIEEAQMSRSKAQFLYKDDEKLHFMNMQDFEQFSLSRNQIGQSGDFLKEGIEVDVLNWNGRPINISLPIKIDLKVAKTEPAVRGNTAQGSVTKPAILETGGKVQVPIFVKVGDIIKVNTETGEYVERVK